VVPFGMLDTDARGRLALYGMVAMFLLPLVLIATLGHVDHARREWCASRPQIANCVRPLW